MRSDLLRRLDLDAAATVGMADGDGESIAGVGLGRFFQAEHDFDHVPDLIFAGGAEAGDGLFHLARGVFINRQVVLRGGGDDDAADLAEGESDAGVLHVDEALDRDRFGLVIGDHFYHGISNAHETARRQYSWWILDMTVTERGQLVAFRLDHTEPGGAKTWVNAKDFHS